MRQMNLACYCVNFDQYDFLLELLHKVEDVHVGAELSMFSDQPEYMKKLKKQKERFQKFPVSFHGPYMEVEATSDLDSGDHEKILRAYDMAFEVYEEFQGDSIVMHTNQRTFLPKEKKKYQENVIETICQIGAEAEKRKVNLLVENVGEEMDGNMLFGEEEYIQLFEKIPASVGALVDIGHAILNHWDLERLIRTLNGKIRAYHLHNNDGKGDIHRPLFESQMLLKEKDWKELFGWMEQYTPHADWILEYAPGDHINAALVDKEVRQILRMLGK